MRATIRLELATSLLIVALVLMSANTSSCLLSDCVQGGSPSRPFLDIKTLPVPFAISRGKLAICTPYSTNIPAPEKLYLMEGQKYTEITYLPQMKGHIHIRSAREAIAYVRLTTSPTTGHLLSTAPGTIQAEIANRLTLDKEFLFGDARMENELRTYSDGVWALVSPATAKELGVNFITCTPDRSGFVIRRTLFTDKWQRSGSILKVIEVEEWVGNDGNYKIRSQREIKVPRKAYDLLLIPKNL